ncbi:MAG: glycosyltransferase [Chitinophagaceae bacterium]|nr:glycosyltransferase [Chitinophagaceae bacterium]
MIFSILIPSWNNLAYLQLCIRSIREHSAFNHQIIVHVNEGSDGTAAWLTEQQIPYTFTEKNEGICVAMNEAYRLSTSDYIVYMNDDMYVLPGWDTHLATDIESLNTHLFMLSSTMIEPRDTGNPCVIVRDFGDSLERFNEESLLASFSSFQHHDWSGSCWPPNIIHRTMWEEIGGYNLYFSPGMSSDDDLAMRLWQKGCRIYKGVSASRVYHFQCKSTGRIEKNNGRKQFQQLYGMSQRIFRRYFLHTGEPYSGGLKGPGLNLNYYGNRLRVWLSNRFMN